MIGTLNSKVKAILTVVVVTITLASIAFFITVNFSPLFIHYPLYLGLQQRNTLQLYQRLLLYLQVPGIKYQPSVLLKTSATITHFGDVKGYFLLNELVMLLGMISSVWILRYKKRRGQLWELLAPLKWLMMVLLILFTMGMVNFPTLFIRGHYLLFNNMDWVINPTKNPIILLMPVHFFTHLFILWGVILLVFLIIFWSYVSFYAGLLKLRPKIADKSWKEGNKNNCKNND